LKRNPLKWKLSKEKYTLGVRAEEAANKYVKYFSLGFNFVILVEGQNLIRL